LTGWARARRCVGRHSRGSLRRPGYYESDRAFIAGNKRAETALRSGAARVDAKTA